MARTNDAEVYMKAFLIGLAIGLLIALITYFVLILKKRKAVKKIESELESLKKMLNDRMDIESSGLSSLKKENEELKKQNENLRITNAALAQKPGRAEVQRLQVYQKAVDRLVLNAPGFGAAWQSALADTEEEFAKIYNGTKPFWKKIIPDNSSVKYLDDDKAES